MRHAAWRARDDKLCADDDTVWALPLLQQINGILGGTASVPPAADINMYVAKVEHLKQAAALANSANVNRVKTLETDVASLQKDNTHLRADIATLRTQNAKLHTKYKKYNDYWNLANELFDDPDASLVFLREFARRLHCPRQYATTRSTFRWDN